MVSHTIPNARTHTHIYIGTVLAKFFIPIYRCIISLLFPSFLLSKWFLLTFCARYTASHQPDQGEPHSSHACPFPCTPLPLPLPHRLSFHLLCHCELETPAHSSKRTEPNQTGVNCMPCVNARNAASEGTEGMGKGTRGDPRPPRYLLAFISKIVSSWSLPFNC